MYTIGTGEAKETPRKRKKADEGAAEAKSPEELRLEALQLLRKSYVISQNGIQGTWGEEATFVLNANAIRAWRPIEVLPNPPHLPVLSCTTQHSEAAAHPYARRSCHPRLEVRQGAPRGSAPSRLLGYRSDADDNNRL